MVFGNKIYIRASCILRRNKQGVFKNVLLLALIINLPDNIRLNILQKNVCSLFLLPIIIYFC